MSFHYADISERMQTIASHLMKHPEEEVRAAGAEILRLLQDQRHRHVEAALAVARKYVDPRSTIVGAGSLGPLLDPPPLGLLGGAHRLYR